MSDPIDRQAAIESVADEIWHYPNECYKNLNVFENAKDLAEHALRGLPSAQPEIIHCRDCKHWQSEEYIGNNNVHTLNIASLPCKNWLTGGDWYCGSAERKDT